MNHFEIISRLNTLGIKHRDHPNLKGWLDVICPMHNDHGYGNASINIYTGVISCYRCGNKIHIDKLYKDRFNQEPNSKIEYATQPEEKKESKVSKYITGDNYNFTHTILKPEKFQYTSLRGFTKEFVEYFGLRHALSNIYSDYLIIPIHDNKKNIHEFEARKLMELNYLQKYFNRNLSLNQLKKQFKKYVEANNIYLDEYYKIHFNDNIIEDEILKYILDKKVKYISGSRINETIFNVDNLDRKKILYEVEGTGSLSKIWSHMSRNCTCTFGSNISEAQINYFQQFEQIISIPDPDEAGFKKMKILSHKLKNHYVIDIDKEDTHKDYVDMILNSTPIPSNDYQKKYWLKYPKLFTNK